MGFLGIDQSLKASGLCRIDETGAVDAISTVDTGDARDGERLVLIKRAVAAMASGVEFAAMEGYAYDSTNRPFALGEIGGVIKVLLVESGIPYVAVPPVLVKKFATGSTTASKEDMMTACTARGVEYSDDNQADAFFLACIARAYARDTGRYRCEMEVLRALRKSQGEKKPRRRARRLVKAAV